MRSSTDLFSGREISLDELLESRDERRAFQQRLLNEYNCTVLSFMPNMPGPVKLCPASLTVFREGMKAIEKAFAGKVVFEKAFEKDTGPEGFFAVTYDPFNAKKAACAIEDGSPMGRLMDIDVHTAGGQISRESVGLETRKCLICGRAAPLCARSRTHSVSELLDEIERRLSTFPGE